MFLITPQLPRFGDGLLIFFRHPFWKKSSHSAWPPEQWALNVIWGMNKWAYL